MGKVFQISVLLRQCRRGCSLVLSQVEAEDIGKNEVRLGLRLVIKTSKAAALNASPL